MQIRVSSRNTSVSQRDRDLITEKIDRLGKYLPGMESAEVHFFEERNPRIADKEVCEVTMAGHGHHVRCKANGPDHLTAVDLAIEKLENKLHKLKSKLKAKPRHKVDGNHGKWSPSNGTELPADLLESATEEADEVVDGGPPRIFEAELVAPEYDIVKVKRVEKLTLTPNDAAIRMDLIGHAFYFFRNADTGRPAVVYRRDDGAVGLIDEVDGD